MHFKIKLNKIHNKNATQLHWPKIKQDLSITTQNLTIKNDGIPFSEARDRALPSVGFNFSLSKRKSFLECISHGRTFL